MGPGYVAPESLLERRHVLVFLVLLAAGIALATAGVKSPAALRPAEAVGVAVTGPLSRLGSGVSGTAADGWEGLGATWTARRDLEAARTELRDLRVLVADRAELAAENERLRRLLDLSERVPMRSVPARVIARQPAPDCILLIDRGTASGVREDLPVISPEGVVGKVLAATANDAKVQCFTDPDAGLAVMIGEGRDQAHAVVKKGAGGTCRLQYLDALATVRPGDRVVTSGLDQIFPKGLLVGSVTFARTVEGANEVGVEPAVAFSRLEEVLVLVPGEQGAPPPGREPSGASRTTSAGGRP